MLEPRRFLTGFDLMSRSHQNTALERDHGNNSAVWIALAVSALLHIPILLLVPRAADSPDTFANANSESNSGFKVEVVDTERRPEDEDPDDQTEELDGQFISAPRPENEERPDEARFLDQYNSKTDREMVRSKQSSSSDGPVQSNVDHGGLANNERKRGFTLSTAESAKADKPAERLEASDRKMEGEQRGVTSKESRSDAESQTSGSAAEKSVESEADEGLVEADEVGQKRNSVDPKELFPSYADAAGFAGGGGSVDYMRDVPEGDKNLLNRKRSRYWSFMDRIRRQVVQQWSPVAEYRKRDPTGDVYGVKDKVSILGVTLNGDGTVRKVYVAHPSGLDFYDDEAVRAIRAAAPFANPPEGLKDQDGLIHFNFMFVLSIDSGGGPLLRIRRR
jgi:TonB family protein